MSKSAYASMLASINNCHDTYRIRFSRTASRLLDGVGRVNIERVRSAKLGVNYIVLTPVLPDEPGLNVVWDGKSAYISMNRIVNFYGLLPKDMFDGKRYKVKRGKGNRKIYICMNEVIEENG